jgi:hypothetical protein
MRWIKVEFGQLQEDSMKNNYHRKPQIILEEIRDLEAYVNGLPDNLRESTVFNGYKQRLIELNNELSTSRSQIILEEITDLADYLGGVPNDLRKSGLLSSYEYRLVELDRELWEGYHIVLQWEDLHGLGQVYAGIKLYELAAKAEAKAIEILDKAEQNSLGLSVVNLASVWLKEGNYRETQRVCDYWIKEYKTGNFPDFAAIKLEEILKIIQLRYQLKSSDIFSVGEPITRQKKHLFVGRTEEMRSALRCIEDEFSLLITGEKGVGKTSFAWQLMELLAGVPEMCDYWLWSPNQNYRCVWLDILEEVNSLEQLYPRLLLSSCEDYTLSRYFAEEMSNMPINLRYEELLRALGEKYPDQKIIVFMNGVELCQDLSGIGKMLKTAHDGGFAQYVIIGNSRSIGFQVVLDDHCFGRYMDEVRFSDLTSDEIHFLLDAIEQSAYGTILFDRDFRIHFDSIIQSSKHPIKTLELILTSFNYAKQRPSNAKSDKPFHITLDDLLVALSTKWVRTEDKSNTADKVSKPRKKQEKKIQVLQH